MKIKIEKETIEIKNKQAERLIRLITDNQDDLYNGFKTNRGWDYGNEGIIWDQPNKSPITAITFGIRGHV